MFNNPECLADHVANGVCYRATDCTECGRWFPQQKEKDKHVFNSVFCDQCKTPHRVAEGYFLAQSTCVGRVKWRYVLFDLETFQD